MDFVRNNRRLIVVLTSAVIVIVATLIVLRITGFSFDQGAPRQQTIVSGAKNNNASDDLTRIANNLNNADVKIQAEAIHPDLRPTLLELGQSPLPKGSKIKFNAGTFQASEGSAQVEATVSSDGVDEVYLVYMSQVDNRWYVTMTQKKEG